jgi:hypothetical protein
VLTSPGPRALLGPVANATNMIGVLEAENCNPVLLPAVHRILPLSHSITE